MDGKTAAVRKQAEEKINFNFIHVETAPKSSLSWGNTRVKYPSCLLLPCCSAYFLEKKVPSSTSKSGGNGKGGWLEWIYEGLYGRMVGWSNGLWPIPIVWQKVEWVWHRKTSSHHIDILVSQWPVPSGMSTRQSPRGTNALTDHTLLSTFVLQSRRLLSSSPLLEVYPEVCLKLLGPSSS